MCLHAAYDSDTPDYCYWVGLQKRLISCNEEDPGILSNLKFIIVHKSYYKEFIYVYCVLASAEARVTFTSAVVVSRRQKNWREQKSRSVKHRIPSFATISVSMGTVPVWAPRIRFHCFRCVTFNVNYFTHKHVSMLYKFEA